MDRIEQARDLMKQGRAEAARALLLRAVQSSPRDADALSLLRLLHGQAGEHEQALYYARRAAEAAPGHPLALMALGDALCICGHTADGLEHLHRAAAAAPREPRIPVSLARALFACGDFDAGQAECRAAIARGIDDHEVPQVWAFALASIGRADEAVAVLEEAERRGPPNTARLSQIATLMNYHPGASAAEVFAAHQRAGASYALPPLPGPPPRAAGPDRTLRVGFVSVDLRANPVAIFIEPLLEHLDRERFELCAYYAYPRSDPTTQRLRRHFALWRDVPTLSPHELAAQLRADRIDIAIDLGGPPDPVRQAAFALRAAPVQVSYMGYPNTTGLPAMDARLVDRLTDPPGSESLATERLVRLDPCFLCYRPPADAPPVTSRDPGAPVVFASFNVMLKINARVLDVWARTLAASPGSTLLIKNSTAMQPAVRAAIDRALGAHGVAPQRVRTMPMSPTTREHLGTFAGVDIVLDPFPYNGTTNTCESLYMGVPVVALSGDRHAARVGLSLLSVVGLGDLVAPDEAGYIATAAALASDPARLAALRASLRSRVEGSALRDERGHANAVGEAMRALWRAACENAG